MDSDRERQALSFLSGLVLGGVIGAGVALLTTPQTGRKTRRRIRRSARQIRGSTEKGLEDLSSELKNRVDDLVGAAKERIG